MSVPLQFLVDISDDNRRLDQFLKDQISDFSRSQIQKWIKKGAVLLNGKKTDSSDKLNAGDRIEVSIPKEEIGLIPEKIPLEILHEDPVLIVVNKPAGMVTHPGGGVKSGTLVNAVLHHLQKKSKTGGQEMVSAFSQAAKTAPYWERLRPGVVHRLDKDTSGVIVIAKNVPALEALSRQFRDRTVEKVYRAIVCGRVTALKGEIEGSIGKEMRSKRMGVVASGKFSKTDFKVLKHFPQHTALEVYPKTGRTHQIRVHLAKIGFPVLGDTMYGTETDLCARQMLHAYQITLRHPVTKKKIKFTAPLPEDFRQVLKKLAAKR